MRFWLVVCMVAGLVFCTQPAFAVEAGQKAAYPSTESVFNATKKRAETGGKEDWLYFARMLDGSLKGQHVDPDQATQWYRRAAKAGSGEAAYYLGKRYEEGHTVEQDDWQASFWFQRMQRHGFRGPEEAQQAAAALTPHEMAKVQERLEEARAQELRQRKIVKAKRWLFHPVVLALGWPLFFWLVLLIASLRQSTFKNASGAPLPVWLGGSFALGCLTGMLVMAASYATFLLFFLGIALLFLSGTAISVLLWTACVLLLTSFFCRAKIQTRLRMGGIVMGSFSTGAVLGGLAVLNASFRIFS